jgi:hypothetical protein
MANDATNPEQLSRARTFRLVWYNLGLMLIMSLLLYRVIMQAADADARAQAAAAAKPTVKTETTAPEKPVAAPVKLDSAATGDSSTAIGETETISSTETESESAAAEPADTKEKQPADPMMITYVLWAISLAGGLGGVLCNLRGVFEFERDKSFFPAYLELPFYLRPVSGVLCGLFTFFVSTFFAGALSQGDADGWQTLSGMFPYIGLAFIAGFASQEFMEKLKETAKTLFGTQTPDGSADALPAAPPPVVEAPLPTAEEDDGHESFSVGDSDLESAKKGVKKPAPPPTPPPVTPVPPRGRRAD